MKIIKKTKYDYTSSEFLNFKTLENSEAVGFIETKENIYFVRFDILEDFLSFKKEISNQEILMSSYNPGFKSLKTINKEKVEELYKNCLVAFRGVDLP